MSRAFASTRGGEHFNGQFDKLAILFNFNSLVVVLVLGGSFLTWSFEDDDDEHEDTRELDLRFYPGIFPVFTEVSTPPEL